MLDDAADPYGDPRLVALYDGDNPDGPDHDFFRAVTARCKAQRIVDLGCGTGLLTVTLAAPGRRVTGIDPSETMLEFARRRPNARAVRWVLGDSRMIGERAADVVIMAGNVAQHIVGDAWPRTLHDVHTGLRPDGVLAFDSRNPAAYEWERWLPAITRATRDTADGPLTEWLEVVDIDGGVVTVDAHNVFESTDEHLVERMALAFRTADELVADLDRAGIQVCELSGGWHGEPVTASSRLLVVTAARAA